MSCLLIQNTVQQVAPKLPVPSIELLSPLAVLNLALRDAMRLMVSGLRLPSNLADLHCTIGGGASICATLVLYRLDIRCIRWTNWHTLEHGRRCAHKPSRSFI